MTEVEEPDGPTDEELARQVDERLHELYQRARGPIDRREARYYEPGRGYHSLQEADRRESTFGVAMVGLDGDVHGAGAWEQPFAVQSISKVFAYLLALEDHGREAVLRRVGVEPSGDSFSSIVFDEASRRPYNPMVNAGALVTADLVRGTGGVEVACERVVDLMRRHAGNPDLHVDEGVYAREQEGADRNRATAYLLRSEDMIEGSADEVLALYLRQCSVQVTCRDLAAMAATLANGGVNPITGARACDRRHVRDVLTVMYTCGMYDFAGEWAFEVGVPAKSGVGGGILVPIPGKLGLAVFSPGLDSHGNSIRGVEVCREISDRLGLHVFASEEEDAVLGDPTAVAD
ncbi:glutaminase A [Iamia majanohamensis]|uniref:Glutaminase n=1 Tax=Iamia majanohamensis TaxID=467976 RepID=A0AAF0BWF2_9ACTN|nr:glutaminase A [Iamia majanohamensis]WCO67374.1 glutaminase A [Iamia majanohamensis]